MSKASGSIDLKSLKVAGEGASKYITSIDSNNGIQVHAQNNTTEHYVQINADGMEVFKDDDSKAFFGETVRIGRENQASIIINDSNIIGYGDGGKEFFNFGNSATVMSVSKYNWVTKDKRPASFPSTNNGITPLIAVLSDTPNNSNIYVNIFLKSITSNVAYSGYNTFLKGTSTTKTITVPVSKDNTYYTFSATYDGDDTFTNIKATSNVPDTYQISVSINYYSDVTAPSYEIGADLSATGGYSYAEGYSTTASGDYSHAEGYKTTASGAYAHAEGQSYTAGGEVLYSTNASGTASHAEGYGTKAKGTASHAEGYGTKANGSFSHTEGSGTIATQAYSHAEGSESEATGLASHAQNYFTIAAKQAQTAIGTYNIEDTTTTTTTHSSGNSAYGEYALIVGNGTSTTRSNALTIDWQGNVMAQGMAGQIIMYAGPIVQSVSNNVITTTAPAGYLLCDGSVVLVTDYPELAAVLGSTYGGDGTTTFGLPDFRGRTGVGVGTGTSSTATAHTLGQTAGSERVTLTSAQIPEFEGQVYVRGYRSSSSTTTRTAIAHGGTGIISVGSADGQTAHGFIGDGLSSQLGSNPVTISFGGGESHNNMQPYVGINYIIATGKTN